MGPEVPELSQSLQGAISIKTIIAFHLMATLSIATVRNPQNNKGGNKVQLVHKVKVMSFTPMIAFDVFIDAKTGEIVSKNSLMKDADGPGTVQTYYNGPKTITLDFSISKSTGGLKILL